MMVLRERRVGYGRKWDSASIRIYLGVADLDVFVKIPHTKIIWVHFFFLIDWKVGFSVRAFWTKPGAVLRESMSGFGPKTGANSNECTQDNLGNRLQWKKN